MDYDKFMKVLIKILEQKYDVQIRIGGVTNE